MSLDDLASFEWHDLPMASLCIAETGIELIVMPYSDAAASYLRFRLVLRDASLVRLDVQGELSPRDVSGLEVSDFEFWAAGDRRLSGKLGILLGSAGFWTIAFQDALWELERLPAVEGDAKA